MVDFTEKLRVDLVEQFREQPNIEALAAVIARQLQDVFTFYEQLLLERDVYSAVGKQLDGIGDIVDLSRKEAGVLAGDPIPYEIIDDEKYRKFLIYKILKNTTHTTYPDIIKAFKMFWDRPLYYTEDPEQPATMIFDTGEMEGTVDTSPLFDTPLIRAAGVTLKLYATTKTTLDPSVLGIAPGIGYALTISEMPEVERVIDFGTTVHVGAALSTLTHDKLPTVEREYRFAGLIHAGAAMQSVSENQIPGLERKIDYNAIIQSGGAMESVMVTHIGDVERR